MGFHRLPVIFFLMTLLALAAPAADEPERAEPEPRAEVVDSDSPAPPSPTTLQARRLAGEIVITNSILEALYGESARPPAPVTGEEEPAGDPLAEIQADLARQRTRREQVSLAKAEVTELEATVKALEKRILAIKNPYLAPPVPPEEDADKWQSMDNVQRLKATENSLAEARDALKAASEKVARLQGGR